jgi:hypothetical protein
MNLKDLEGKTMIKLSIPERRFISDAYLRYFDTLPPRERLLGYCVIYCGIPSLQVGKLDMGFQVKKDEQGNIIPKSLEYSLWLGDMQMHLLDNRFEGMVFDYISTDERFMKYMNDESFKFPVDDWFRIPLFAPKYHGKSDRLHDCRTFLVNAGKAIGFNARKIALHKLNRSPYFLTPLTLVMFTPKEVQKDGTKDL